MNRFGHFVLAALVPLAIASCSKRQAHANAANTTPSRNEPVVAISDGGAPDAPADTSASREKPDAEAHNENARNGEVIGEGEMDDDDRECALVDDGAVQCLGALPPRGPSLKKLFPADWKLLDHAEGDLDGDGVDDLAFVIQGTDESQIQVGNSEDQVADRNPRILAIYFKNQRSGMFEKKLQSNGFIMVKEEPTWDEPFAGIAIRKNGTLMVSFHFWTSWGSWSTWDSTHTFRYQGGRFKLIGYDYDVSQRNTGETKAYSANYLTKKMIVTTGTFEKGETKKKTVRIEIGALRNLDELTRTSSLDELDL